jgi:hypothetical protein
MNTKINLTYKGEEYTLEYNRMSVKLLENAGFVFEEFLEKPMNNIDLVFNGAFIKNHRKLPQVTIDEIFDHLKDKKGLITTLQKMIQETYDALLDEPEDGDEGNATWEVIDLSPTTKKK